MPALSVHPIFGIPEVSSGDSLAQILWPPLQAFGLQTGDILVLAQKIVSKAEGQLVSFSPDFSLSPKAKQLAKRFGRDPFLVEWVLRESLGVVKMDERVMLVETHHGFVCANAGIDSSNTGEKGGLLLLPRAPDKTAKKLALSWSQKTGFPLGVIVADSFGRPFRLGVRQVALGAYGVPVLEDFRGRKDDNQRELQATQIAWGDELASAAGLVCGKTNRVPMAVLRGFSCSAPLGVAKDLLRPRKEDLFRQSMPST